MIRTTAAGVLIALVSLIWTPANANATDDVRGAMLRFAGLSSYEMTFGTGAQHGTIDFVKPDSMHMFGGTFEVIRIGRTTYMKQPARGWIKMPNTEGGGAAAMATHIRTLASEANAVTATDLGMKSVDGETLHAYRMTTKDRSSATVYVGRDGLPHRIDSGNGTGNIIHVGKFNAVAPIRAPI